MIRSLVGKLPTMLTPKRLRTYCQPITVADEFNYLISAVELSSTRSRFLDKLAGNDQRIHFGIRCKT